MAGRVAYYGGIVKDGLVLDLDAAKKESYPGSGTVWRDIAGGVITGSLVNGPTFNSGNGGSIVFDGVDDYTDFGTYLPINGIGTVTFSMWVYAPTNTQKLILTRYDTSATTRQADFIALVNGTIGLSPRLYVGTTNDYITWTSTTEAVSLNSWTNLTFTVNNPATTVNCYVNGSSISLTSTTGGTPPTIFANTIANRFWRLARIITSGGASTYYNFSLANLIIYNRALNATEVIQNYNALKGRYGLT
jgi:hypothetical protein